MWLGGCETAQLQVSAAPAARADMAEDVHLCDLIYMYTQLPGAAPLPVLYQQYLAARPAMRALALGVALLPTAAAHAAMVQPRPRNALNKPRTKNVPKRG